MQGRLLKQTFKGFQGFPGHNWPEEFYLSAERGLSHVEWIIDWLDFGSNPLIIDSGEILKVTQNTSVRVQSLCLDFLMQVPLDSEWDNTVIQSFPKLKQGVETLGIRLAVLPFVDQTSILSGRVSLPQLERIVEGFINCFEGTGLKVALELDLPPLEVLDVVSRYEPHQVGVNYDIGNSASLGYHWEAELNVYGSRVDLVHIKDRKLHGSSVHLGEGCAELSDSIEILAQKKDLIFTMQAFRDEDGLQIFDSQLEYLMSILESQ